MGFYTNRIFPKLSFIFSIQIIKWFTQPKFLNSRQRLKEIICVYTFFQNWYKNLFVYTLNQSSFNLRKRKQKNHSIKGITKLLFTFLVQTEPDLKLYRSLYWLISRRNLASQSKLIISGLRKMLFLDRIKIKVFICKFVLNFINL